MLSDDNYVRSNQLCWCGQQWGGRDRWNHHYHHHHHTGQLSATVAAVRWGYTWPAGHQDITTHQWEREREGDGLQVSVQPGRHGQRQSPRQHQGQNGWVPHIQKYQVSISLLESSLEFREELWQLSACKLSIPHLLSEVILWSRGQTIRYQVISVIIHCQLSEGININSTICSSVAYLFISHW